MTPTQNGHLGMSAMFHTDTQYDTELHALRGAARTMANDVERQFQRAVDAVRTLDLGLANDVLIEEASVNQLHLQIDARCNQIIARRQPIAVDLREIIAIMHMNSDLERIGDEAKKIAIKVRMLQSRGSPVNSAGVQKMAGIVSEMLRTAIDAFVRHDPKVSKALQARDDEVDALRDQQISELVETMSRDKDPGAISAALAQVFVVQSIERVGDHAKNIAEYVVTVVEGVDPRHGPQTERVYPGA
jgi:phosphate transport system protein